MPALYTSLLATVDRLLQRFGQDATLTKVNTSVAIATGVATPAPTTAKVRTVVESFKGTRRASFGDYGWDDNTNIIEGDKLAHISGNAALKPEAGDQLTIGGIVWNVLSVQVAEPGGIVIEYFCQIRR